MDAMARLRAAKRNRETEQAVAKAADGRQPLPNGQNPMADPKRLPGDPRDLRGIPAVGVRGGMGGAILGTTPGSGLK